MPIERNLSLDIPVLENNRQKAVSNLEEYLKTSQEVILREHQVDVMEELRNFLNEGQTAGYIALPTGSGKTVLFTELTRALRLNTVILSPTQTILRQTSDTFERFSPEVSVGNFYTREKNLSGDVLNTTYQSLLVLIERGQISPAEIELLICDEAHMALGEQRHRIFRKFPNALKIGLTATPYFMPLAGYERRGLVRSDEPWVDLFKKCIHEMSLEEAMQREILAKLDVHMMRTNVRVDEVEIAAGDYSRSQLERLLNIEARNYLTVAAVAGTDKVPQEILADSLKREEVEAIHQKIGGKRTTIFGISISHVEKLAQMLKEAGISAETVHANIDINKREQILKDYAASKVQVVLGVDILRIGWDSPQTEVGIYLAPTRSGIVAVQELGRILRPSPETGKERAIAIQMVDEFRLRTQAPILIPNIFDPYYVLRGTQEGLVGKRATETSRASRSVPVTFAGWQIEATIHEALSNELLRTRFKQGSLAQMAEIIDRIIVETKEKQSTSSVVDFYRDLAEAIPRVSAEKQLEALQAVASIDSNVAEQGKKVVLFTSLRTIFNAVEPFLGKDNDENEELIQAAIVKVFVELAELKSDRSTAQEIYMIARKEAASSIAAGENVPPNWVFDGVYQRITAKVDRLISANPQGFPKAQIETLATEINQDFGVSELSAKAYLRYRFSLSEKLEPVDNLIKEGSRWLLKDAIQDVLASLTPREQKVLIFRFGLEDGRERTLNEVGRAFHVIRERVRQIEARALMKLRHPSRSRKLRDFLDEDDVNRPIRWPPERDFSTWPTRLISYPRKVSWEEWVELYPLPKGARLLDEAVRWLGYKRYIAKLDIDVRGNFKKPLSFN